EELVPERPHVTGTEEPVVNADRAKARLLVQDGERVETILPLQRIDCPASAQRHRADSPARIVVKQPIDVIGLVRAMEGARPEVDDPGGQAISIFRQVQSVTPRFQMATSRSSLRSLAVASPEAMRKICPSSSSAVASSPR